MREALRVLLGEEVEKRVEMGLAKDGSGVGGAYSPCTSSALIDYRHRLLAALGALQATKNTL